MGLFDQLKNGLAKTRKGFVEKVESIFSKGKIDKETIEELEEALITSDVGIHAAQEIVNFLREKIRKGEIEDALSAREALKKRWSLCSVLLLLLSYSGRGHLSSLQSASMALERPQP